MGRARLRNESTGVSHDNVAARISRRRRCRRMRTIELPHIGGVRIESRGEVIDLVNPATDAVIGHAVIVPWNGPAPMFAGGAAPALACGNAVVMKPSELTPASAGRLAELSVDAGMPLGLVNVVPGDGSTGEIVTNHRGIATVNFTGS